MANPENLKDKGFHKNPENINRKGRPKKLPNLELIIAEVLGGDEDTNRSGTKQIIAALKRKAAKGDVRAAELLLDRAYGKVKQPIDLDATITIKVSKKKDDDQPK